MCKSACMCACVCVVRVYSMCVHVYVCRCLYVVCVCECAFVCGCVCVWLCCNMLVGYTVLKDKGQNKRTCVHVLSFIVYLDFLGSRQQK